MRLCASVVEVRKKTKTTCIISIAVLCKFSLDLSLVLCSAGWILTTRQKIFRNFKPECGYRAVLQGNVIRGISLTKRVNSYDCMHLK